MNGRKHPLLAALAISAIAMMPLSQAVAGGHGYGLVHPWGVARGVVGAVVAIATLPLVIASAALSAVVPAEPEGPAYGGPPAYYPAPAYYAPAPYYGAAPYYGPRTYSAGGYGQPGRYSPRGYAPGRGGYYGAHNGGAPSRSGQYSYRR
jgi:hypothetical protein